MTRVVVAFAVGVLATTLLGGLMTLAGGFLVGVALSVLGNDIDRNAAAVGVRVVKAAALLVPAGERQDCVDEWTDDVRSAAEDGQGVRPLLKALGIALIGAPLLAVLVRYDPQRRTR